MKEGQGVKDSDTDWAFHAEDAAVLHALETGEHAPSLREFFGTDAYAELSTLAARASLSRATRPKSRDSMPPQKVLILPGIMGSKLGRANSAHSGAQVLWVDPLRIAAGQLTRLALPRGAAMKPLGVMLFTYAKLKLMLDIAGFDARFHAYDWRLGIDETGAQLAARIAREPRPLVLVAHSMGGLVARAALSALPKAGVRRLITVGTPHLGSFAAVQALCGTYPTVRKIAMLDLKHSAEDLAKRVFRSFTGLYDLLPVTDPDAAMDVYDPAVWPAAHSNIDAARLSAARTSREQLAAPDSRYRQIIGVDQPTCASIRRYAGGFAYDQTLAGDGTVPAGSARLPGVPAYYVPEIHGNLVNNSSVIYCIIDLIRRGRSCRLPQRWACSRRKCEDLTDTAMRKQFDGKTDWRGLDSVERERAFAQFSATPDESTTASKPRQKIEIRTAFGSIADAKARALVLGMFRNVAPGGAAAAVDQRLGGAVREFTSRRMFSADAGQIFVLPAGQRALRASTVVFAGMGDFDRFDARTHEFVSENVVRTLSRTGVEEFATVLMGTGSGISVSDAVTNQMRGYLNALRVAAGDFTLRKITFCAVRRAQFEELRAALRKLKSSDMFAAFDPSFKEERYRPAAQSVPREISPRMTVQPPGTAYLIVSQERATDSNLLVRAALLSAGAKAAVFTDSREIRRCDFESLLDDLHGGEFNESGLKKYGERLGALMLGGDMRAALTQTKANTLSIVHDAAMSQVPWETLRIGSWTPATAQGLSRRYAAENLSIARWSDSRRLGRSLEVLLVADPTQNLPGAKSEARRLISVLADRAEVRLQVIQGAQATKARLLDEFRSGEFDVLHYAGHAHFDPRDPGRSGIICAGGDVLSGGDLSNLHSLPALVFFNACETGRLRGSNQRRNVRRALATTDGLAEAFLRGGVANYLGTYWPVGDEAATAFATAFYASLVAGDALGSAVNSGRAAVRSAGSCDWADYMHYGSQDFVIKTG